MPAVRRLFLITNTGTAAYFGITTGLITLDLSIALSFGMRQRERESHAFHADGLRSGDLLVPFAVARFLKDLIQGTHVLCFFEKQPDSFFEILQGLLFSAPA